MKSPCLTFLPIFALCCANLSADPWPQYRGAAGDGKSAEKLTDGQLEVLWTAPTPFGFSSFSVAEGKLFTLVAIEESGAKREACIAMDATTGKELWRVMVGLSEYGHDGGNAGAPGNKGGDGPRSTPTTDGKHVWVYPSNMHLRCLDSETGKTIWDRDLLKDFAGREIKWKNATSPIIEGNMLIVGGGGEGQSFIALDKNSGDVIWKSGDETMTHATPQLANVGGTRQAIFFMTSGLVGLDAKSGNELWRAKFPFSVSTAASPIASGDMVYCSAGYGVGAGLFKVTDAAEAEELWFKPNELMNHWSTPLEHDGHLYGIYEFKKYGKAPLQCVELATGEIKWSERGFGPGNCILAGDKLIVLSDAGEVAIVKASPGGYNELSRVQAVSGKCWSTPALSDGRIYVRSTEQAACLVVK